MIGLGAIGAFFGSALGKGIMVAVALAAVGLAATCTIDAIGDAREERLRKEAIEDRLRSIRESNTRAALLRALPALAKARCAAEGRDPRTGKMSECCGPDAVKIARCTAPIGSE